MLEKLVVKNIYKLSVKGTKEVNEKGFAWVDVPALGMEVYISLNEVQEKEDCYVLENPNIRKLDYTNQKGENIMALDKLCNLKNPNGESASFAYLRKNGYIGCTGTINGSKVEIQGEMENGFNGILKGTFKFDVQ